MQTLQIVFVRNIHIMKAIKWSGKYSMQYMNYIEVNRCTSAPVWVRSIMWYF